MPDVVTTPGLAWLMAVMGTAAAIADCIATATFFHTRGIAMVLLLQIAATPRLETKKGRGGGPFVG